MQKPSRIAQRKIRLMQSELQMLQHYHQQIEDIFGDYQSEYSQDIQSFIDKARELLNKTDEKSSEDFEAESEHKFNVARDDEDFRKQNEELFDDSPKEKHSSPEWAKKLFKKIALMTHPDRIKNDELRESLRKTFLTASKALEEGKLDDLIGVAVELNIDAELDDVNLIPLLDAKIKSCRQAINEIEETEAWQWGESLGMENNRVILLHAILNSKGYEISQEQAAEMLKVQRSEP